MTQPQTPRAPEAAHCLCPKCAAEAWNLAAQKFRDERTAESHNAAQVAKEQYERAVRACNSHAALVAALEAYRAWHKGKCGSLSSSEKLREAGQLADAALAAAKP